MTVAFANLLSGIYINAVVKGGHQRLREIQIAHAGAAIAPLAGNSGFISF